jgi:hypothetical protein
MINRSIFLNIAVAIIFLFEATVSYGETSRGARGANEGQSTQSIGETIDPNSCPQTLVNWVKDDFTDKSTLKVFDFPSEAKVCTTAVRSYQAYAQQSGQKTEFSDADKLSTYLTDRYKQVAPAMKHILSKCNSLPNGQDKIVKTRYYMAMEKFENYNNSLVDEIAYIDSVLPGSNGLEQIECNEKFPFPTTGKRCKEYQSLKSKSCVLSPEQKMNTMVSKTMDALNRIQKLDIALKECNRKSLKPQACELLQVEISRIENENPWLQNANYFQDVRQIMKHKSDWQKTFTPAVIKSKITKHLSDNRDLLKKQYERSQKHIRCMSYTSVNSESSCKFEDTRKLLAALPDIPDAGDGKVKANREFDSHIDAEKCLVDRGLDRAETKKIIDESIIDGGLTAATAGLGVVASSGLKMVKGMSNMNRVRAAGMVSTAAAGVNILPGLKAAYESCNAESQELAKFSKKTESLSANVCPDPGSKLEMLKEAESSCLTDAILSAADILPFTAGLKLIGRTSRSALLSHLKDPKQRAELEKILASIGGITNDEERAAVAGKLLDKTLSSDQKKCIISAHKIGAGKAMRTAATSGLPDAELLSQSDLNQKKGILRSCGFDSLDISLLMRTGITGESPRPLPPGADDFFRSRILAAFGREPSLEEVRALIKARTFLTVDPEKSAQILRSAGFAENDIKIIVNEKKLEDSEIINKARGITLSPRLDPVDQLKNAMENRGPEEVRVAYAASKTEVERIIQKSGGQSMSVDQLSDLATRGLSPADAAKYAVNNTKNDADLLSTLASLDRKIAANSGKGIQGDFSAAQIQEMKYELMQKYYAQKFNVKSGYSILDTVWDKDEAAGELLSAAAAKLDELRKKRHKLWPSTN